MAQSAGWCGLPICDTPRTEPLIWFKVHFRLWTYNYINSYSQPQACMYACMHECTHAACMHAHTHARTHTHIHSAYMSLFICTIHVHTTVSPPASLRHTYYTHHSQLTSLSQTHLLYTPQSAHQPLSDTPTIHTTVSSPASLRHTYYTHHSQLTSLSQTHLLYTPQSAHQPLSDTPTIHTTV